MIVTLNDGSTLTCDDQPFTEGGEGYLFWEKSGKYVVKLYKPNVTADREAALQKIIGPEYSVVLGGDGKIEPYWDELFAWPKSIIVKPLLGLTMPKVKGMDLMWYLGPKPRRVLAMKEGAEALGKWTNYLAMAIRMARVVRRMHFRGLCHSDLSFRNFLADARESKIILIDCDGLVVPGFLPAGVLGTPKCMAPELMMYITSPQKASATPSSQTDLHALSTLIYWLLLQRHPLLGPKQNHSDPGMDEALALGEKALFIENHKDKSNNFPVLPLPYARMFTPEVQRLVQRAFMDGLDDPSKRPAAADWERFLTRMTDSVVPCDNPQCPLGAYIVLPGYPATCPACQTPTRTLSTLPLLHMYRPQGGRQGHFMSDRGYLVVGWPDRGLHVWHAMPGQEPGPGIDHGVKAAIEYDRKKGKWYFANKDLAEVRMLDSVSGHQDIHPGVSVEITDGVRLMFGPPDQCRLAYVEMMHVT